MRKKLMVLVAGIATLAVTVGVASAATSINYTGQGMDANGPTTGRCSNPDNGGTGAVLVPGQQYLLFVMNGSVTGPAVLHIGAATYPMVKVGSTYKVVTPFYTKAQLLAAPTYATFASGSPNNLVVSHGCGAANSQISTEIHKGLDDVGGAVPVASPFHMPLGSSVHDSATVTTDNNVAIPSGSSVTFTFTGGATVTAPVGASGKVDLALPQSVLHAGTYKYTAVFNSGNTGLVRNSTAADEPLVIDQAQLEVVTQIHDASHGNVGDAVHAPLGSVVHDTATVSGAVSGISIGAVSFTLNGNSVANDNTADGSVTARSVDSAPLAAGSYTYAASVAGNSDYIGDDSPAEPLTVDKAKLKITTQIHGVNGAHDNVGDATHVALGSTVHDTATITGQVSGFTAPGASDVSFTLNGNAVGQGGTGDDIRTVESDALHAGSYTYKASVTGNANYEGDTSADEPLTVDKAQLSIETVIHKADHTVLANGSTVPSGTALHDTAVVSGKVAGFDTGSVSFTLDGGSIGSDNGNVDAIRSVAVAPPNGDHKFAASVAGNDDYIGANSTDEPFTIGAPHAFCSPGFWKNTSDANWALTGYSRSDLFNATVVPSFYDTPLDPTLTLGQVTDGAGNTYGGPSGPFGLNPFNAVGAFLSNHIPGFQDSDGSTAENCPLNNGH